MTWDTVDYRMERSGAPFSQQEPAAWRYSPRSFAASSAKRLDRNVRHSPGKQTSIGASAMSALCQKRTSRSMPQARKRRYYRRKNAPVTFAGAT
jgi:hypothetical protein